jgi:3-methyladenine DNA glycosylase AlkD
MTYEELIKTLKKNANPKNIAGMARFGINPKDTLGITVPFLRKTAKQIGKDHELAIKLWKSGIHEARILASMIDDPKEVSEKQMDSWIADFDSWDVCDQVCMNLFDKTPFAFKKASEWTSREPEFERRAGFALMACLAWHDKTSPDEKFKPFFSLIKKYSTDERNFVKKAVNWALRQIGKSRPNLKKEAIKTAEEILKINSKSAQWIAKDALKELSGK